MELDKIFLHQLYEISPYWPDVYRIKVGNTLVISTLARINHKGIWYSILHCQSGEVFKDEWFTESKLYKLMSEEVYKSIYLYIPQSFDYPDEVQFTEYERLMEKYGKNND